MPTKSNFVLSLISRFLSGRRKFATAAIAGFLLTLVFATAAFAHDISGNGSAECLKDGTYKVTVTFTSWKPKQYGGSNSDIGVQKNINNAGYGDYFHHGAFTSQSGSFTINDILPGATTSARYRAKAINKWDDNVDGGQTQTVTVDLPKPCVPQKGRIRIVKTVVNGYGGTLTASQVELFINGVQVANNTYLDVDPGTYSAYENAIADYTASEWSGDCNAAGSVTVKAGESKTCRITNTQNPNEGPSPVCKVWDLNENKEPDGDEQRLAGWTIRWTKNTPSKDDDVTVITGENGCAEFTLPYGTHQLCEDMQPDWVSTTQECQSVTITPKPPETKYFLNRKKRGDLDLLKINDLNGNGAQDGTEVGQGGITMTVYIKDSTEVVTTGVTANDGYLHIKKLPEGDYKVCETVPPGWKATGPVCQVVKIEEGKTSKLIFTNVKDVPTSLPEVQQPGQGQNGVFLPSISSR